MPESRILRSALSSTHPFTLRRRGVEAKLILGECEAKPDTVMIKAIAQSIAWLEELKAGASIIALASQNNVSSSYVRKILKLAYLSPTIVESIIQGRQPTELTLKQLQNFDLPLCWTDQAKLLKF